MATMESPPGAPSRDLRVRAAGGWERFMRRVEADASRPSRDHAPREYARPWGATRLAPYPHTVTWPFARTEIDPVTQTTLYFDAEGRAVDMSGHGTNQSTASPTATGSDGGGAQPPPPSDSDALEDHVPD